MVVVGLVAGTETACTANFGVGGGAYCGLKGLPFSEGQADALGAVCWALVIGGLVVVALALATGRRQQAPKLF